MGSDNGLGGFVLTTATSGERPPCIQRNLSLMDAARGRKSNASMNSLYKSMEYLKMHSSRKLKNEVRWRHSWFPLNMKNDSGFLILIANK